MLNAQLDRMASMMPGADTATSHDAFSKELATFCRRLRAHEHVEEDVLYPA